nr:Chain A, de novo designed monomer trefoil-fold sub-domain which forms homo-trimer assembly [synthetic construct]3OL0_B Chain B, de novo designed monomer trefoil-fold sub-domain which forms homo-trimer assembly [synthetic construct]3OL0_C Chain C, de novo designed monomer trefoil-fold sub-domain which forms homo-trimer assembly [synthetic construct]
HHHHHHPVLLKSTETGQYLRINPDGTVDGTRDRSDPHIQFQISPEGNG